MDFKEVQKLVYIEYNNNGYRDKWNKAYRLLKPHGLEHIVNLAEVGLINEEVGEALHEVRKPTSNEAFAFELADIVIRCLNAANRNGISLEEIILAKNEKNIKRGFLHGGKL